MREERPAGVVGASGQRAWNVALDLLTPVQPGRLLEAAAGGGFLAAQLAARGFRVTGLDLVNQWRQPHLPLVLADLDDPLPFKTQMFDAVVIAEAIGYVSNVDSLLREFHRVLRPGGVVVITMPNIFTLQGRLNFLFNGEFRWFPHPPHKSGRKPQLADVYRDPTRLTTLTFNLDRLGFSVERTLFGSRTALAALAPIGLLLQMMARGYNAVRRADETPSVVNSLPALLYTNVGVLARRRG